MLGMIKLSDVNVEKIQKNKPDNKIIDFFKNMYIFLKDSLLLLFFPTKQTSIILKRKLSIPLVVFIAAIFSGIHFVFNLIFYENYNLYILALPPFLNPHIMYNTINVVGLYWQIFTFFLFVIPFSTLLIDLICSKFSRIQNKVFNISKVFLHMILIAGLYPLINLFLVINRIHPFVTISDGTRIIFQIQIGQIVEGIIIGVLSIFIIYKIYKTKLGVILSQLSIALSFIFSTPANLI